MNTQNKTLTNGMILKGDKVLELGFDQIWIDGEFPCDASEVEGIEELADIDMEFVEELACDSFETCMVQKWISVSGDQRIWMTKKD